MSGAPQSRTVHCEGSVARYAFAQVSASLGPMRRFMIVLPVLALSCGTSTDEAASGDAAEDNGVVADTSGTATDSSMATDTAAGPDEGTPGDTLVSDAGDTMGLPTYGPYPPGPYGNKVGDVLPNLKWRGFVNSDPDAISTTKPIVDTSLDALRRTARKPYALLHASEFT
jgi:hypothetical protein